MPAKKNPHKSAPRRATARKAVYEIPVAKAPIKINNVRRKWMTSDRFIIYVYWAIILFFVSSTFYILGRGQEFMRQRHPSYATATMNINVDDYMISGKAKLLSGDILGAIDDLSMAIDANPELADAHIYRGEAFMQMSDTGKAMMDFDRAIEINPQSAVASYDRAILYARVENYPAAFADINNALEAHAWDSGNEILTLAQIYSKRAQFNLWSKNWAMAAEDYTTALHNGSNDPSDFAGRAEAYTALGAYSAAVDDYLSAIRMISEQIVDAAPGVRRETMSRQALVYFEKSAALRVQMGDLEGARTDLHSAITIAGALNDVETVQRMQLLVQSI